MITLTILIQFRETVHTHKFVSCICGSIYVYLSESNVVILTTCKCIRICICMYLYAYIFICICICVFICVYLSICACFNQIKALDSHQTFDAYAVWQTDVLRLQLCTLTEQRAKCPLMFRSIETDTHAPNFMRI